VLRGGGISAWFVGIRRIRDIECILKISGRMLLRDEERIKVPKPVST
jgi:hypothetical protein